MRLFLNQQSTALGTLRLWQLELRNKLFSSPTEFVWTEHDISPIVSGGLQTFTLDRQNAHYLRHGDIVFYTGEILVTATGVPNVGNSVSFDLPVPFEVISPTVSLGRKFPCLCVDSSGSPGLLTEMALGDGAAFYDLAGAGWANGSVQFYWNIFYRARN